MTPVDVEGLTSGVVQISAGSFETCALLTSSEVKCWGSNTEGQLGAGNDPGPEFCHLGTASLACSSVPVLVGLAEITPAAISVGGSYVCALSAKASAVCWGSNFAGVLGDGTTTPTGTAISVVGAPVYEIGDANCDRSIDAVDAALVLQAVVNVLSRSLPCMQNVDVNHSIYADAQDATLILQFGAGLISLLRPT